MKRFFGNWNEFIKFDADLQQRLYR